MIKKGFENKYRVQRSCIFTEEYAKCDCTYSPPTSTEGATAANVCCFEELLFSGSVVLSNHQFDLFLS